MRGRGGRLSAALLLVLGGAFAFYFLPATPPPPDLGRPFPDAARRAVGVLHVHSRYSDGAGDLAAIGEAARRAELDFFVLTDHNHLDALSREGEAYDRGVLRLVGAELSTDAGHVLALGIPDPELRFGGDPLETLRDVAELGGFSLVAHPYSAEPEFAWQGWDLPGYSGLELLNLDSAWRQQGVARLALAALLYPFSARRAFQALLVWDGEGLARWDEMLARRPASGWAGLDAHGRIPLYRDRSIDWPPYEELFRSLRNHLILSEPLAGELERDRALIYEALREGRGYLALDALADGSRFDFRAEREGESFPIGSLIPIGGGALRLTVRADAPPGTRLRLLRDGRVVQEAARGEIALTADAPGVYRAEAWLPPRYVPGRREQPWIVSNPIYFLDPADYRRRAETAGRFPAPPGSERLDCESVGSDSLPVDFHAEHDPESKMSEAAARSTGPRFQLAFELSRPGPGRPYVWCAVADRAARDLSGFTAVRFRVRADGVYRVGFQLRDHNPRLSEQTEWWEAAFKTASAWKEVVLPFDRFRSLSTPSDGKLDLDATRGLFFVLDAGKVRPGVSGVIDIEELGFCRAGAARSSR